MTADEELMEQYQMGSQEAFDELYRRYSRRVLGYLRKKGLSSYQAEEVFQQVFMKLHHSRQRFNRKFSFSSWIFTLSHHALIDFVRRNKKWDTAQPEEEVPSFPSNPEARPVSLEGLKESEKQLVGYRYLDERTYGEISTLLGISEENVRQKVSRAIRRLRKTLGRKHNDRQT